MNDLPPKVTSIARASWTPDEIYDVDARKWLQMGDILPEMPPRTVGKLEIAVRFTPEEPTPGE